MHSDWDNTLVGGTPRQRRRRGPAAGDPPGPAPGHRSSRAGGHTPSAPPARTVRSSDVADLCQRAGLDEKARQALAEAGALQALAGHRNDARWVVAGIERQRPLLPGSPEEAPIELPCTDHRRGRAWPTTATLGLTLGAHPLSLLRDAAACAPPVEFPPTAGPAPRQRACTRPGWSPTASVPRRRTGTMFVTLEDEHGMVNVVVWEHVALRQRKALLGAPPAGRAWPLGTGRWRDPSDRAGHAGPQ